MFRPAIRQPSDAEDGNGNGLEPVDQDRFVESRLAVEVSGDEITPLQHFPGRGTEGPLVDVEQRGRAQLQEKRDKQEGNQQEPGCARVIERGVHSGYDGPAQCQPAASFAGMLPASPRTR